MTIAPVRTSVDVKCGPARAFDLFTARMGDWWARGQTIGAHPHVAIVIEPHASGRWYERDADGAEVDWGKVLAWEPPARLVLGWMLNARFQYDSAILMEVEIGFAARADGGTTVTLEHRNLEQLGDDAAAFAASVDGGWAQHLTTFSGFCDQAPEEGL